MKKPSPSSPAPAQPNIFSLLTPYRKTIWMLAALTLVANGLSLWVPRLIANAIDDYARGTAVLATVGWQLGGLALAVFVFMYLQNIVQTFASERVAKDLRNKLSAKISNQTFAYIQSVNPSKLLTNLTSDIDAIKTFVAQAVSSLISSLVLIIGAAIFLLITNWQLALSVLLVVPIIGGVFFLTLKQVRTLFFQSREIIDRLNKVINEGVLGATLIRVLASEDYENKKFAKTNTEALTLGTKIVGIFSRLIPVITFFASATSVVILWLGGHFLLTNRLSLGDFAAFNTYMTILIFPIFVIGFISNMIAQASASYGRIAEVLDAPIEENTGTRKEKLKGAVSVEKLSVQYGEKAALKAINLSIQPGTKTAIIGPTAAGKTQLLYTLTGLIAPTEGTINFDGHPISDYDHDLLHQQIGFVFQDSIIFNTSLRENIGFTKDATNESLQKAIETAELGDFVETLPEKLDTLVSERGTSLSGGQKQRVMLARALALDPTILLLDDFTARVDTATEKKILANLQKNYPNLTLISVTQKVASVEHYDQIIVLMEGEILASGTHKELLKKSPEYVQIYTSQQSTETYELHA